MHGDTIMQGTETPSESETRTKGKQSIGDQFDIEQSPVVSIPVSSLTITDSPRTSGENSDHVELLAAAHTELPPIIVHRPSMRVIDGVHRLRVAELMGQQNIAARFFSGDEADAFVLAVKSNIAHGLPLSLAERKTAARRIIVSHSQWSDRMVGSVTGLSARTIAEIRRRSAGAGASNGSRIGRDGRTRPLNGAEGRRLAYELISENPKLSLREVARAAGISPETVRDVRNRLSRGEDPVPVSRKRSNGRPVQGVDNGTRRVGISPNVGWSRSSDEDRALTMKRLRADPALRFTETGRNLLRLLHIHLIASEEWQRIEENIPPHCSIIISRLARECAQMWQEFAEMVERRVADIA